MPDPFRSETLSNAEESVLKRYPKAVFHMHRQLQAKKLGLILGAGIGKPLGFPNWSELIQRVAQDSDVSGNHLLADSRVAASEAVSTECLFQHFRSHQLAILRASKEPISLLAETRIRRHWQDIVRRNLYHQAITDMTRIRTDHPYLSNFINVIRASAMTINYNFDDTLERLLLDSPSGNSDEGQWRGCETVCNANLYFRSDRAVIYHPNGFLPFNPIEASHDGIVLSEYEFADQMLQMMSGHQSSVLHHLSKNTCMFLGLSMSDHGLKHLLYQHASLNPGNYHYYVFFLRDDMPLDRTVMDAVTEANFYVYNLVTLFLTVEEIAALGRLLAMRQDQLLRHAEEAGVISKYVYYLTGTLGVGKTTSATYLRSLITHDEWLEFRPPELARSWRELSEEERMQLDEWIDRQFAQKNWRILNGEAGIHLVDRPPLDPLAFAHDPRARARAIQQAIRARKAQRAVQPGHIIFLRGQPSELHVRVVGRHKGSSDEEIGDVQDKLWAIYGGLGVTEIDTQGLTLSNIVRKVAHTIFLEEYRDISLEAQLATIIENGIQP